MDKKITLIMFLLLINCFSVFSASSWFEFGNTGNFASGYDGYFFGSAYLEGNNTFIKISDSVNNDYMPIVYNPLDDVDKSYNYIYTFTTNSISVYNATDGALITTRTISDICGQPILFNWNELDDNLHLAFINGTANKDMNFVTLENNTLVFTYSFTANPNSTCIIESGFPIDNEYIYSLYDDGSLAKTHVFFGNSTTWSHGLTFGSSNMYDSATPYYSHPLVVKNLDSDSQMEVVISATNGATTTTKIFDSSSYALQSSQSTVTSTATSDVIHSAIVQMGSITGQKEIYVNVHKNGVNNDEMILFYDLSLNLLKAIKGTGFNEKYLGSIADVDYNGVNEFCYIEDDYTDNFICLDSSYSAIINISFDFLDLNFMAMGEYDNKTDGNSDYMELLTPEGIYIIQDNLSNLTMVYNFTDGYTNENTLIYPVSLRNREDFIKDVLVVTPTSLNLYYSEGVGVVCGNGNCEVGETILTCPSDCLVSGSNLSAVHESCNSDNDCYTGKCEYHLCMYKTTYEYCTNNDQCLSGVCENNKCTKDGIVDLIGDSKNQIVGTNQSDSNFFCMIIIMIVFFMCAVSLRNIAGIILGLVLSLMLSIFFVTVSWLSTWIFVICFILIVLIGAVIVAFKLFTGGDN